MHSADKIKSDYEHHRALTPLLSRETLTKDLAKGVLASAAKIDSDYECAQVLVEVASAIPIDDELRPAFERAADTIQGEYEYGRAMSAVRRRVTKYAPSRFRRIRETGVRQRHSMPSR